ncbi:MAG: cobalt-precorrin-6A reductase, partial [Geitlerinemataceae cyanobacterium]
MTNDPKQIWLIGGTTESAEIARSIAVLKIPCIVSVTTESAKSLYPETSEFTIKVGKLEPDRIQFFLQQENIIGILDASHPYAIEVSQMAIVASQLYDIAYLRYERPQIRESSNAIYLPSFETLLNGEYLTRQRVLLTVGYRPLELFKTWQAQSTLFARILPSLTALEAAIVAGFTNDRLIALRPPISAELETALWRQWKISIVVTKASGTAGGEDVKQTVAAKLGIGLIIIDRPSVDYLHQTNDVKTAIEFCQK